MNRIRREKSMISLFFYAIAKRSKINFLDIFQKHT